MKKFQRVNCRLPFVYKCALKHIQRTDKEKGYINLS